MLLNEKVEVKVVGSTLYHYKQFYKDAQCGDKILVNISELPSSSIAPIQVQCDSCGKIYKFKFSSYEKYRKENLFDAKYECRQCEIDRIWNNIINECEELNFELLSDKSIYKTNKSKIEFICKNHENYGIQKVSVNNLLSSHTGCNECSKERTSELQRLDYDIVFRAFEERGYVLIDTDYKNAKQQLKYICPKHPEKTRYITYDKIKRGQGCWDCGNEKVSDVQRLDIDHVKQCFLDKDLIYLDENTYTKNSIPLKYICKKHTEKGIQTITLNNLKTGTFGCKYCAIEYRASLHDGVTPIYNHLRRKINQWLSDSMKDCNYLCVLTGERFDVVHHLYGFNMILREVFDILNYPINSIISDYSSYEMGVIEEKCLELHYNYGLGVCLARPIHDLFHDIYLRGDNTPEQFEEFKARLKEGEFLDFLEENNLHLKI